jgi:hypothetical protein
MISLLYWGVNEGKGVGDIGVLKTHNLSMTNDEKSVATYSLKIAPVVVIVPECEIKKIYILNLNWKIFSILNGKIFFMAKFENISFELDQY